MKKHTGHFNAARIFAALGRIGYTPVSALLDLVDNSVSAKATKVYVGIELAQEENVEKGKRKRTIIKSFVIADNGKGMDEDGLHNALTLGSSNKSYEKKTLSKFGLGLKSAASSLGECLSITSITEKGSKKTAFLDQAKLGEVYEYEVGDASPEELAFLKDTLKATKSGTVIRITNIHQDSLPPAVEIIDGLKKKAGITFFYYLAGKPPAEHKVEITIAGGTEINNIQPYDPLFVENISKKDGNLDERSWDGVSVKWIQTAQNIQLDLDGKISAQVEMTSLPHPPSVAESGTMTQTECREKYNIGAGNYGFYIYRNGRLISWADSIDGLIPMDQDLYAFRGRLLISDNADDVLNLDVTKSRIQLSDIARQQLSSLVNEGKKKCQVAWRFRSKEIERKIGNDPHAEINAEIDRIADLDEKSDLMEEEVAPTAEKKKLVKKRKQITETSQASEDEKTALKGKQRIQYVDELDNNQLWARAHDPEEGLIVRVNKSHRLYRDIISVSGENSELIKTMDIFFYALARAEYEVIYSTDIAAENVLEKVMEEYRERVGGRLSETLRKLTK